MAFNEISLKTGVWYDEQRVMLRFPDDWDLTVLWPKTPPALSDTQIAEALERPVGQPPIRELCRGKSSPLVIVDDPNRPTPASRVLPHVLIQCQQAGIDPQSVRILVATGTHGAPRPETVMKKIGPEAWANCQVLVHNAHKNLVKAGITSVGTPIAVNREVLRSDIVMGIGGIYPNHTAGFGGGSKLALGVLGFQSIRHLHYGHQAVGWCGPVHECGLRRDLDEICKFIRLNTIVSLQINAEREVVRVDCGDPLRYYENAVDFCRETFSVPGPECADVVVSNAFPNDLSLTFSSMKGMAPLHHCVPQASRIAIASCSEGLGCHGLYPLGEKSLVSRQYQLALRMGIMGPRRAAKKIIGRLGRGILARTPSLLGTNRNGPGAHSGFQHQVWLYRPGQHSEPLPPRISSIQVEECWEQILQAVSVEQRGKKHLRALVYPCGPLQILGASEGFPMSVSTEKRLEEAGSRTQRN
jgi:lactate racemase